MIKNVKKLKMNIGKSNQPEFNRIIDNSLVGVFQSDTNGKVLYMNKPLLKKLEYRSVEEINKNGGSRIFYKNPEERDKIVSFLNKKHYVKDYEIEFVSKTGKQIFIYLCMRMENNILSGTIVDITRLKRAENQLRKARDYSELLLTFSPSAIFTVDLKQRITRWNKRAREITGYSAEEVIGKKCTLFMNSPCKNKCGLYSAEVKKPVICKECKLTRKDGQIRIILKSADFLNDENGNVIGGIESLEDITERKQAEEKLLNSEYRFRELFNNMDSCVAVYEARDNGNDFIFKDFNKAAEKLERIKKKDILGKSVLNVFPGVKKFGLFKVFKSVWKTGMPRSHPISFYHDQIISGWRENFIYKLPAGEIVAIYNDVTERKKVEEQLLILSKFPLENPYPVLRISGSGEILYKNPAVDKLIEKAGLLKKDIFNILPENIINIINKALKNKTTISDLEVEIGSKIYSYTLSPIPEQKYVNLYGADVTERKKIEMMRESAFREVSHELKTPIAMIEMAQNINQLAIKNNNMSQIIKTQDIITNNIQRLSKDVNNILAMFLLKKKRVLNKIQFSVKNTIEEIIRNIQYILFEKKLRIKTDIPKNIENIFADPREIKILLNNIIDNAIKFTEKGFITVSVRLRGEFIRIAVKDTGYGMSPEVKENIFTRFYKRHPAVPGTGLGLTISKEIVELHNGKIKVFSKGEGKGAIVAVYLPVSDKGK